MHKYSLVTPWNRGLTFSGVVFVSITASEEYQSPDQLERGFHHVHEVISAVHVLISEPVHLYISAAGMQTTNIICATGAVGFLNTDIVVGITAAVTGTSALIVGFLAGVLLFYCISNCRHQSSKLEAASHPQPESVSVCNPLQQTGPQYEEVLELGQKCVPTHTRIEMKANEAYGPV